MTFAPAHFRGAQQIAFDARASFRGGRRRGTYTNVKIEVETTFVCIHM
jgi:hypothetical protein